MCSRRFAFPAKASPGLLGAANSATAIEEALEF
jgi:hypothetical protein